MAGAPRTTPVADEQAATPTAAHFAAAPMRHPGDAVTSDVRAKRVGPKGRLVLALGEGRRRLGRELTAERVRLRFR